VRDVTSARAPTTTTTTTTTLKVTKKKCPGVSFRRRRKNGPNFLVEFEKSARGRFKSFMHLWMKEFCRELD
jgi:hypothetical protein